MLDKPFAPACERNRDPILAVLREAYAGRRRVLEIGSGTGQHAVHFAAHLPHLSWQTSDLPERLGGIRLWLHDAALPNTPEPLALDAAALGAPDASVPRFDAVFTANTLHIMGWPAVQRLFQSLGAWVEPGAVLAVYGPMRMGGQHTSPSNAEFDAQLRQQDPAQGIRDLEAVDALARAGGWQPLARHAMPANNQLVLWHRA